ncbi:unnamed protein product, partial [Didymodactylos carnosus]
LVTNCYLEVISTLTTTTIASGVYSQQSFVHLLSVGGYVIISAGRNPSIPTDMNLSDRQIDHRTDTLKADLEKNLYLFSTVLGVYDGGREVSFFISLHDRRDDSLHERQQFMKMGTKYNQDSIIYTKGITDKYFMNVTQQLIYTTGQHMGNWVQGKGYVEFHKNVTDNYSEIQLCPTHSYVFSLNFNFTQMFVPMSATPLCDCTLPQLIETNALVEHQLANIKANQRRLEDLIDLEFDFTS